MSEMPFVENPVSAMTSPFRILIMDTEPHVNLLKDAFKLAGHAVVPAHTLEHKFIYNVHSNNGEYIQCFSENLSHS